jgi:hypothetical protein
LRGTSSLAGIACGIFRAAPRYRLQATFFFPVAEYPAKGGPAKHNMRAKLLLGDGALHDGERPAKRARLLSDSDRDSESSSDESGGIALNAGQEPLFKINEEYARRFEHNHKRAELHRCMSEACWIRNSLLIRHSRGKIRPKDYAAGASGRWQRRITRRRVIFG